MKWLKPRSVFARRVLTLMTGTALAQGLPVLAAPALTRLYTPQDFGVFAMFFAMTALFSVMASGRYELAVLLPESDNDAGDLVVLGVALSTAVSLVLLVCALLFGSGVARLLGNGAIRPWLVLVPLSVWAVGVYQTLNYWFNRKLQYRRLAANRVLRSTITIGVSLALGVWQVIPGGLVAGLIAGQVLTTMAFAAQAMYEDGAQFRSATPTRLAAVGRRYRDFPRYSVPADAINSLGAQMPVFLLTSFFGPAVIGFYGLTQRVLAAPVSIIASAFADVYAQRASAEFNRNGNCQAAWQSTFVRLALLAVPPFVVLAVVAPSMFAFVFGEEWRVAGEYARLLTPFYVMAFVASPLSRTLYVAERQKHDLAWQIGLVAVTASAVTAGGAADNAHMSVGLFAAGYAAMYVVYLFMSYRFSGPRRTAAATRTDASLALPSGSTA
ncbi:MAG: oligosaccharide flippase family protein [Gemmatimonadetes bacterium]|nr:oligosaccharide flippase family protein [Gemmatimonadota bacterium]